MQHEVGTFSNYVIAIHIIAISLMKISNTLPAGLDDRKIRLPLCVSKPVKKIFIRPSNARGDNYQFRT